MNLVFLLGTYPFIFPYLIYCDFHNSAESHLRFLRFDFHQSHSNWEDRLPPPERGLVFHIPDLK